MNLLEFRDLAKFTFLKEPRISPNKGEIALVTAKIDLEEDDYKSRIIVLDGKTGEIVFQTGGPYDLCPRWSSNGKSLLFLSRRTLKKEEKGNELWVVKVDGGEPTLITKKKYGISSPQWSPDGRKISFISPVVKEEEESKVKVIRRIPVWFNGVGFTYNLRKHLFTVDVYSRNVEQVTEGEIDVLHAAYSNKGDKIAFVASVNDLNPRITDLFLFDVQSREVTKLTKSNMYIGPIGWGPGDRSIAFIGHDLRRGFSTHETLWVISLENMELRDLTRELDRGCTKRVYCDVRGHYFTEQPPIWIDKYIYFPLSEGGSFNLYRFNVEGNEAEPVIKGQLVVDDYDVDGNMIAYVKFTDVEPPELWVKDESGNRMLTSFNEEILREFPVVKPEKFEFTASDGEKVEGWIMRPVNYEEGKKYPLILFIHGGPKSKFGYGFMFEHQLLSHKGYVIAYTNPRGSDGYSEEFADIRGKYGERDFQDLMEAVKYIVKAFSFVDGERMGVTGISYGGFMTNWIVTHTNIFRAAVSQNGISSWMAEFGTSDIGFYFVPDQIGGDFWTNGDGYNRMSPINYAKNTETPIMFIHSWEDYRCWVDQALLFYTSLKYLGREAELVLFMEGEHVFGWTGKPSLRIERMKHILRWFDEHLTKTRMRKT